VTFLPPFPCQQADPVLGKKSVFECCRQPLQDNEIDDAPELSK